MVMGQSVADFFKDREEYLKRPPVTTIGGVMDHRDLYTEGIICCIYITETDQYIYKDENDNEYFLTDGEKLSEMEMWQIMDTLIRNKKFSSNVRDIVRKKKAEREVREEKRENIKKHAIPYFMKEKPLLCKKAPIELVLREFISYWYGWEGWRGIIVPEIVEAYVENFLVLGLDLDKVKNTEDILEAFEKKIRKDGGVAEISS
ncbi:unnamed protein product [marine sediment metagenome]|uniref:Uncharacterized protein n=1 Tax=marine sediment metagenome TaxID=412755 RepID=X1GLB9_9ZZZZ